MGSSSKLMLLKDSFEGEDREKRMTLKREHAEFRRSIK